MTTSSITTKFVIVLLTGAVKCSWAIMDCGQHLYAKLDTLDTVPVFLWKLCARITSSGEAMEALTNRGAARLGVDMDADVLEPMLALAYPA